MEAVKKKAGKENPRGAGKETHCIDRESIDFGENMQHLGALGHQFKPNRELYFLQ